MAGNGSGGYTGDGGLATSAEIDEPTGITLDASGDILFSDYQNSRVRMTHGFPGSEHQHGRSVLWADQRWIDQHTADAHRNEAHTGQVTIANISASLKLQRGRQLPGDDDERDHLQDVRVLRPDGIGDPAWYGDHQQ